MAGPALSAPQAGPAPPSGPGQPPAAPPGALSPFGWTGIRRERYARWKGRLHGRKHIIIRMVWEGVRFNLKTTAVLVVFVLGWLFSMLLPLLMGAAGFLSLEAGVSDTYTGTESTQAGMHRSITNSSTAEYQLEGAVFTNATQFATINVPVNWTAYVNASSTGGLTTASLVVVPDPQSPPNRTALIQVRAVTGLRTDTFSTATTIVGDPAAEGYFFAYGLRFSQKEFEGSAGSVAHVRFNLSNKGTIPDAYNVTLGTLPDGWGLKVQVNGSGVPLKTKTVSDPRMPEFLRMEISYFRVDLAPGQAASCDLAYSTAPDSAKLNSINVGVASAIDPVVTGSYYTVIRLSDTKLRDLTGSVLYGQVMSIQVFFALLLAALVGSRAIATDLQEKSYNLYFARPLSKTDYILGKFGTVGAVLGLATIVPTFITYGLLMLLTKISSTYVVDHLWAWGAIFGFGMVVVLTFSTLSLAFSSLTSRRFYAAAALVVIYLVTAIVGQIATQAFQSEYAQLIGVSNDFDIAGRNAFGIGDELVLKFPWYYSLAVLAAVWVASALLVWWRVDRTELSE